MILPASKIHNAAAAIESLKSGGPVTLLVEMEGGYTWFLPDDCPYGQPGDVLEISERCVAGHHWYQWATDGLYVPTQERIMQEPPWAVRFRRTIDSVSVEQIEEIFYWKIGVKP